MFMTNVLSPRVNLTLSTSDDGLHWRHLRTLYVGPSAYSSLLPVVSGEESASTKLLCLFERGGPVSLIATTATSTDLFGTGIPPPKPRNGKPFSRPSWRLLAQ